MGICNCRRESIINALSIDVEEHFQVEAFAGVIDRSDWENYPTRVVENTRRVLRLLDAHEVRATFFVLGWIAERRPELVREIAAGGHEIASHGYWHRLVYRQTPEEFAADIGRSIEVIGNACPDARIVGYRAPSFSITDKSKWALDILPEFGIKYDSSIFPMSGHDLYGIGDAPRFANKVSPQMYEFPVSTVRCCRRNWPVAGGGYFRLFPLWVSCLAIRRINAENQPAVMYLHPWELDPEQPRVPGAPAFSRFRHYVNLRKTEGRLRKIIQRFRFAPMREVFSNELTS